MDTPGLPSPYIVLKLLDGTVQKVVLNDDTTWTLGRDRDNKVVIPDSSVSRHHALLQCLDSNSVYLIDLGSSNGSFVNQRRVSIPTLLRNKDQLTLGQSEIEFYSGIEASEVDQDPISMGGDETAILNVRRLISVLVVDIRGFTQLTQSVDEQVLSKVIGEWFQRAEEITRRNGSKVDKYIGDAVMAVWFHGKPEQTGKLTVVEQELRLLNVLEVFQSLRELFEMTQLVSEKFSRQLPYPIRIGAGINTGHAIVGQMGSGDRQEYTVLGDTVNTAFRLESATRGLDADIVISEPTYMAFNQDAPPCFTCAEIMLKGYSIAHQVYYCKFEAFRDFLVRYAHKPTSPP